MTDSEESWETSIAVDLLATVRASRKALPYLEKGRDAAIVNISSISGLQPTGRSPAYGAVKAAVMLEDVARTVHVAQQLGQTWRLDDTDIDSLYDRYQNVYGQQDGSR